MLDGLVITAERQRAPGDDMPTPRPPHLEAPTAIPDLLPASDRHEITSRATCWHVWPPELDPDSACERCHLAYQEWSM
ncbi:hypothetical protein Vqi01_49730 [Micromonospora qiuiae]|uniref:Uncharacterized protein n=1 Tax=Micromonospora qiuiae TaxID=502268 RepID=A0ABQ4JH83_9ACTN|nr:hypothetical protein Vqi01_49730 [Micromonospora qiuiae]